MSKDKDKLFAKLLKEGRKERLKAEKPKTMGEAKQARVAKTKTNILDIKRIYDEDQRALLKGTYERDHLLATIAREQCQQCGIVQDHVDKIEVIKRSTIKPDETLLGERVNSLGMYQFHYDLPIKITSVGKRYIPACNKCLLEDQLKREQKRS